MPSNKEVMSLRWSVIIHERIIVTWDWQLENKPTAVLFCSVQCRSNGRVHFKTWVFFWFFLQSTVSYLSYEPEYKTSLHMLNYYLYMCWHIFTLLLWIIKSGVIILHDYAFTAFKKQSCTGDLNLFLQFIRMYACWPWCINKWN